VSYVLSGGIVADTLAGTVTARDVAIDDGGRIGGDGGKGIDCSGCLVVPGFVCAHHHLYSALARGMPFPSDAPENFLEVLQKVWWRLDRALDHETIGLSALLASVEAARCGTTTIVDHHESPSCIDGSLDLVAGGLEGAGLRGVVCYGATDRHGQADGRRGVEENSRFLTERRFPLVRGMAGAHASFTVGKRTLDDLVSCARDHGAPLHIHVAEDSCDQDDALGNYGMRVVERLEVAGALAEGDLIAHGIHLDAPEVDAVRASGSWVAHNPRSNMNNRVGYAPVAALGERVALGTDGIDSDMLTEARACYFKAREASNDASPAFALDRLVAGCSLAGEVFGEESFGRLETGAPADVVVLEYAPPTPLDETNLASHMLFGIEAGRVRDVFVAGRAVVRDRKHQLVDEVEVAAHCREAAPRLWERMEAL